MVSELPWDSKTGTLKREMAQGMMDPASASALEAALQIRETQQNAKISAIAMGPPMAREILHQAQALGVDEAFLLTDRKMAGADTFLTSYILAQCVQQISPDFDLILCGAQSSDSETAQVGPQLAETLDIPCVGFARTIDMEGSGSGSGSGAMVRVSRHVDDFMEELEMDLPGLLTVDHGAFAPRYLPLEGIQQAFESPVIQVLDVKKLGIPDQFNALKDSPTRIIDVYSPTAQKENRVLKGAVKTSLEELFKDYGKIISGAMGKDLKTHEHGEDA